MSVVQGRRSGGNFKIEADRIKASSKSGKYTELATTLANGSSDTAITSLVGGSDFFTPLDGSVANFIEIYSDRTITIKLRTEQNAGIATASLKSIQIKANTTRTIDFIADITEIYLSNSSGSTANFEVVAI